MGADGSCSRDDFTYDHEGDVYFCPAGKMLTCKGTVVNDNQLLYRASKYDCDACSFKPRCCPREPARKVPRSIYEGLVTWPATSPRPMPTAPHAGSGRRSRC